MIQVLNPNPGATPAAAPGRPPAQVLAPLPPPRAVVHTEEIRAVVRADEVRADEVRAGEITVRELRGREGLEQIRTDWARVLGGLGRTRKFHHLPEWADARLAALETDDGAVRFFVLYRGGCPVGIFPLRPAVLKRFGVSLRSLEIPQCDSKNHADFVFEPGESQKLLLRRLVDHLRAERGLSWDVLHLSSLHEDSSAMHALRAAPPPRTVIARRGSCNVIRCEPLEAIERGLKKSFRSNLRRARNKLGAIASREFLTTRDPALLPGYFEAFLDVEASGWKGGGGTRTAIRHRPRQAEFYRALMQRFGSVGACEINLLKVDGRCIAGQFCFVTGGTTFIAKIGYDEEYAKLAPGQMLLEELLRRSAKEGRTHLNLASDEPWTRDWNPESVPVYQAYVFNVTPLGLLGLAAFKALAWLRRFS